MNEEWKPWPDLAAMMERAKQENLWFFTTYQGLWFSPADLEKHWSQGEFHWGAVNWQLRDPQERLAEFAAESADKERQREQFARRIIE